jgi:hypothetical protein
MLPQAKADFCVSPILLLQVLFAPSQAQKEPAKAKKSVRIDDDRHATG